MDRFSPRESIGVELGKVDSLLVPATDRSLDACWFSSFSPRKVEVMVLNAR